MAQVVDGDTLRLNDGRRVRLIGLNATELGHDGRPPEPHAQPAREALQSLLGPRAVVGLRYGRERHDRYGRLLAHVYLADGRSVEAQLLERGLAAQIVVPPNTGSWQCYRRAERLARAARRGVWGGFYRPVPVATLARDTRGFRVVTGRVVRVGESRRSLWLNFSSYSGKGPRKGVAVRIDRDDLRYFEDWNPRELGGQTVIVRGWLYPYKQQQIIRLRHPAGLERLPPK